MKMYNDSVKIDAKFYIYLHQKLQVSGEWLFIYKSRCFDKKFFGFKYFLNYELTKEQTKSNINPSGQYRYIRSGNNIVNHNERTRIRLVHTQTQYSVSFVQIITIRQLIYYSEN